MKARYVYLYTAIMLFALGSVMYLSTEDHQWTHAIAAHHVATMQPVVGKILVINLDRRQDRMAAINTQLGAVGVFKGIPVERLSATDGKKLVHHSLISEGIIDIRSYQNMIENSVINGELMTIGGLGCYLSHVNAWRIVAKMQTPALILEDDIRTNAEIESFDRALESLPGDFGIFYLVNMVGEKIVHTFSYYNEYAYRMNGEQWGTSAYVLTPAAASLLLAHALPARQQVDSYIIEMCFKYSMPVYMSRTNLVSVPNSHGRESDVQRYTKQPVMIPKVFHRIWFGDRSMDAKSLQYEKTLRKMYPGWRLITWTDERIRATNMTLQHLIDRVNITAAKSDIARYEILYKFGGVYIDTDVEPLRNIEYVIGGVDAFVGYEDHRLACNAIIGSTPGHEMLRSIIGDIEASWDNPGNKNVNFKTGPEFFTKYVQQYHEPALRTFAPHILYPYLWNQADPGTYSKYSYMVHHWSKGWWKEVGWK